MPSTDTHLAPYSGGYCVSNLVSIIVILFVLGVLVSFVIIHSFLSLPVIRAGRPREVLPFLTLLTRCANTAVP